MRKIATQNIINEFEQESSPLCNSVRLITWVAGTFKELNDLRTGTVVQKYQLKGYTCWYHWAKLLGVKSSKGYFTPTNAVKKFNAADSCSKDVFLIAFELVLPTPNPVLITRPDGEEIEINVNSYHIRTLKDYAGCLEDFIYTPEELTEAIEKHFADIELDKKSK